jgi:glycosyltransferase involved in cell wall biosynthesis
MKVVSVIVPVFNEEASLEAFYEAVRKVMDGAAEYRWQLLFINDGSGDGSQQLIEAFARQDQRVCFVELSRNFGKENAMLCGFDYASGDCAVVIDADLQHPPHVILEMLSKWEEGYEDVYAKRRDRGRESWLRHWLSLLFYRILDHSTSFDMLRNVGDFRLLDRKCIDALREMRETERYTKGLFSWMGFRKYELQFNQEERRYGQSHWNYMQLFALAIEGITSFTIAPLRFATITGTMIGIGAIFYMLYVFMKALIWGDPVAGFPTLICVILFLGSIQLICLGIMGEYLGRIFNESKRRPNYLVRKASAD